MTFKEILRKIFFLPPLYTVIAAVFGFGLVLTVAIFRIEIPAIQYISYIASAYALTVTITGFPSIVRAIKKRIKENPLTLKLMKIPIVKRYFTEPLFKAKASLYFGLLINLTYIAMKLISGIFYGSVWLIALAIYYIMLALTRVFLVGYGARYGFGESIIPEWRRYRLIGILLLVLNTSLGGIVILVVYQNKGFEYPGLLIYAMAAYSFYTVTLAIINTAKARKHGSPAASATRAINLVSALVSMLSLTTAMLAQFGGDDDSGFRPLMTGCVGGGVCLAVLGIAIFMIIRSTIRLKKLKINNSET